MIETNKIYTGDCREIMATFPDGCVDMILCDLPYGTTQCKWDTVIPFESLWAEYKRIIKPNGAIVLTANQPFTSALVMSNIEWFRYSLVWEKASPTGYLNANRMPMRAHEDIVIFYSALPTYNPQKTTGHTRKASTAHHKRHCLKTEIYGEHSFQTYDSTERYPRSVLRFASDKQKCAYHPTQKPVALFEYLILTYTNAGDLVLDNCIGSGTTAVACIETGRQYIGIEQNPEYVTMAEKRIAAAVYQPTFFS